LPERKIHPKSVTILKREQYKYCWGNRSMGFSSHDLMQYGYAKQYYKAQFGFLGWGRSADSRQWRMSCPR